MPYLDLDQTLFIGNQLPAHAPYKLSFISLPCSACFLPSHNSFFLFIYLHRYHPLT
jgi:hypothetical protein